MAHVVSEIEKNPIIGRQLFDIITSGMYDNPLMVYREYIQNAVDSIDLAVCEGLLSLENARITINLRGQERCIVIEDNGNGLSNETAHGILINLGCSPKDGYIQRGFRGIGRLGGLAYCDELIFETRSFGDELVSVVRWNRKEFDAMAGDSSRQNVTLQEIIQAVANLEYEDVHEGTPPHFFRVTLRNVHRFHSDMLMNLKSVNDYLAQSAPVPFNRDTFAYAREIENRLAAVNNFRAYHVRVNDRQLFRPYADEIRLSTNNTDRIAGIEFIEFKGTEPDSEPMAIGWYAKTSFLATLPSSLNVKGIRVRQGNIEVGGEHFLEDKFSEARFSGWQIGEIHVVNGKLKPNARRDGFEHTPGFEKFLEQLHLLGRHLSSLCRKHSNNRIASAKIQGSLAQLENLVNNPLTYIDEVHYKQAVDDAHAVLQSIDKVSINGISDDLMLRLDSLKEKLADSKHKPVLLEHVLDERRLRKFDHKSLLQHVAKMIISSYRGSKSAEDILQHVLADLVKPTFSNHKINSAIGVG